MSENELPLCTSDLEQEVKIRLGEDGFAALPPRTLMECFDVAVHRFHNLPALFQKKPVEVSTENDIVVYSYFSARDMTSFSCLSFTGYNYRRHSLDHLDLAGISQQCRRLWQVAAFIGFQSLRRC